MQSTRLVPIPLDHVLAEMAAFPLASETALRLATTCLDPSMKQQTDQLWRQAESESLGHFPGFSIDEAVSLRDRMWFGISRETVPLHKYLRRLANAVLEQIGNEATPRLPDHAGSMALQHLPYHDGSSDRRPPDWQALARRQWRWLAFALPSDLLLAAVGDSNSGPDSLNLLTPALERVLQDRGYAEMHLHYGAALDFPLLWVSAMHAIADSRTTSKAFVSPGAGLNGGNDLAPWLVRAALARYVLAAFLRNQRGDSTLMDYLENEVRPRLVDAPVPGAYLLLRVALASLKRGHLGSEEISFETWQALYRHLTGLAADSFPHDLNEVQETDPIANSLPWPTLGRPRPEVRFIRAALQYLETATEPLFETLFWQVVRVRGLFYRHSVQRPMTPGLQWFIRFYGRLSPARKPIKDKMRLESAAQLDGRDRGLRSLEVRTSPSANKEELRQSIDALLELQRQWLCPQKPAHGCLPRPKPLELGIVFHFLKERSGGAKDGCPQAFWMNSNADPDPNSNPTGYRFAKTYMAREGEAMALAWVLRYYPLSLQVVRGIDVCNDELGTPNWVFAPLFNFVRQAADVAAGFISAHYGRTVPRLRTTVHAGEDFVHLQTGLRMLDEAIDQFELREGDRIGHGMALGIDPRDWARRTGRLAVAIEDRLLDLVWEWTCYGEGCLQVTGGSMQSLEYEIADLTRKMFGAPVSPYYLDDLRRGLANTQKLKRVGFPRGPGPIFSEQDKSRKKVGCEEFDGRDLLHQYLTCHRLFERGRNLVLIDPTNEGERLVRLQANLRRKVGRLGIVVEINPTSNLLIGDLEDLTVHPMWRLRPPRPLPDETPPVSVCVGSDDPMTFNSALPQEYQCLWDAMKLGGLSDEEARQWLNRTRECSLENRFTLDRIVPDEMQSFTPNYDPVLVPPL